VPRALGEAMISLAIPVYDMPNKDFYLSRCLASIKAQTFTDYEIVITEAGKMAENTNAAIKASKGDLIKILYMDDYFKDEHALGAIVELFTGGWLVTGCINDQGYGEHYPTYNHDIHTGNNTIGSPSVLTILNDSPLLFDESMTWMLDCDYYKRLYERYGPPTILNDINVVIGIHPGQATNRLSDDIKHKEEHYLHEKYN
jgi:hypothetical protein